MNPTVFLAKRINHLHADSLIPTIIVGALTLTVVKTQPTMHMDAANLISNGITLGIMLSAAACCVGTTVSSEIQVKIRDLSVMRALGVKKNTVFFVYLLKGLLLGTVGSTVGAAFATLTLRISAGTSMIPDQLLLASVFGIVAGLLGSAGPAWKASNQNIAEALRS